MSCSSPQSDMTSGPLPSFRKGVNRRKNPAPYRAPLDLGHCTVDEPGMPSHDQMVVLESPVTPPTTPAMMAVLPPLPPPAAELLPMRPTRVRKVIHRAKRTRTELQGPCSNCQTTTSPQWRKGPKNKPILCNACGIRFHRNKTLDIPPPRTPGVKRKAVITVGHPLTAYFPMEDRARGPLPWAGSQGLGPGGEPAAAGFKRVRGLAADGSSADEEVLAVSRSPRRRTLSSKALDALNLSGLTLAQPDHSMYGMRHVHSHMDLLASAADMLEELGSETESEDLGLQDQEGAQPWQQGDGFDAADTPSTTSSGAAAAAVMSAVHLKEEGTSAPPPPPMLAGRAGSLLAALPPRPPAGGMSMMKRVMSTPSLFVGQPSAAPVPSLHPPAAAAAGPGGEELPDYMAAVMALRERTGSIDAALDLLLRGGGDMVKQQPAHDTECVQQQQEARRMYVVSRTRTKGPSSRMNRTSSAPSMADLAHQQQLAALAEAAAGADVSQARRAVLSHVYAERAEHTAGCCRHQCAPADMPMVQPC